MIELKNIVKEYKLTKTNKVLALNSISLKIEAGEFVAIVGKSGSGKSTLLNMIGLLDSPDKGNIVIFDKKNVKPFSRQANKLLKAKIGYLLRHHQHVWVNINQIV